MSEKDRDASSSTEVSASGVAAAGGERTSESTPATPNAQVKKTLADVRKEEVFEVPYNNRPVVFTGFFLAVFLAALDQTVVATALPTIIRDLGADGGYSWIGTAYLLTACSIAPLYGKFSDLFGRKGLLHICIAIFLIGSALCGAAQSFAWLAICRGVQGVGGGGILQLVVISISDIVPLAERGKWTGALGSLWGISSVLGPLIGGLLTDRVTWRWAFWINLPTGGLAMFLLLFLNLKPVPRKSFMHHMRTIDFVGLFSIVSGTVLLLVGFNSSQTSWDSAETIALLVIGALLLVFAIANEFFTSRQPILSPRLFKTRTTGSLLIGNFLHGFTFFGAAYYLPLYFQILGSSATMAGVRMLPFSFVLSVFSVLSGFTVSKTGKYRPVIWFGFGMMAFGYGLMIMLDDRTSQVAQEFLILVPAFGIGCLFQPPLIGVQSAMPAKDMAIATAAFGFTRQLSGTIGISVGNAIYTSQLRQRLGKIDGIQSFIAGRSFEEVSNSVKGLTQIQPLDFRNQILHAYAKSVSTIWLVATPLAFVGFCLVLTMRQYSLSSTVKKTTSPEQDAASGVGSGSSTPNPVAAELPADHEEAADEKDPVPIIDREKDIEAGEMSLASNQEQERTGVHVEESKV